MADSIHTRITKAREAAGMKQKELARRLLVTPQAVHGWEKGKSKPRQEHINGIVAVLRTTYDYLLKGVGPIRDGDSVSIIPVDIFTYRDVPLVPISELVTTSLSISSTNNKFGGLTVRALTQCSDHAKAFEMIDDSMEPVFHKTDIIVVDPAEPFEPGDYVAAHIRNDGVTVFRQFKYDGPDHCILAPLNGHFRAYRIPINRMDDEIQMLGSYVEHTARKRRKSHTS